MLNILLICVLINVIKCQGHFQTDCIMNTALKQSTNFFEKLRSDYAFEVLNKDISSKISGEIMEHVSNVSKTIFNRHKREISEDFNKGINILKGFQDFSQLNFSNIQDVNFFSLQNELESTWFAVILDTSKISLFQINNDVLYPITTYLITNGTQITVNSCTYGALLIIQIQDGTILVLRFIKTKENYYLYPIQDFEFNDITHLTIWHGMNLLYLGVASHTNISIFIWFGDYFDLVQVINYGTKKLIPFYSKGFMYLAVTGSTTLIFKYFLKSNEFVVTQILPSSQYVSSFQVKERHFIEHFLSLSTESSTVIYKEIHDRFIPFQQISFGQSTVSIILNKAILLLCLSEDTMLTYQYDGWRFVELNIKLSQIHQFRRIALHEKDLLLVKYNNNTWTLKQPLWAKQKSYNDFQEEIRVWNINSIKITQKTLEEIPDLKNLKILRGHINHLFVYNINEHNSQALKTVSDQYKIIVSKLQKQKIILSNKLHSRNLTLSSLHAKQIKINCKTKCKVNCLNIKGNSSLKYKLEKLKDQNQLLNSKIVNVKEINNWKCPFFSLPIENIIVNKSINGILLDNLKKNVLKVNGNQEVSREHIFSSMNVKNALIPLDVALSLTKQEIQTRQLNVKKLNLIENEFLLPLNGTTTVITGSIKALKVKVKRHIFLKGGLSGNWTKHVSPVIIIPEPLTLHDNIILEDAKIENLISKDLISNKAGSIKDIFVKAIPLYNNVSVSLILSNEKMKWSNVTLYGPQNWITANSQNRVVMFGKKYIFHNVEITKPSYNSLKHPRTEIPLCGATVIVPEVKTTTLVINNITVKKLNNTSLFGTLGERYLTQNSTSLFKPFKLAAEQFYHNIIAKNIFTTDIHNINLTELKRLLSSWIKPNILKTSVEATDLIIDTLQIPVQFSMELPKVMGNVISEQNTYVDIINNVNFTNFLANTIKLKDMISLANVTFGNDFTVNHIYVSHFPLSLTKVETNPNLYKKRIFGSIETNAMNLPYSFAFTENGVATNIIVKGSATFLSEPTIENVNKIKLKELFTKIWLTTKTTDFYGKNLHFKNISIQGNTILNNFSNTLNIETWKGTLERILSKTRPQDITVFTSLNNVQTSTIVSSNASSIKSTVSDFNDMFENTLVRDRKQKVEAKWTFNKLKLLGKLHAEVKINKMNFKTDVMRHDSKEVIVTGKKTVVVLTTKDLNGLNFDEWANDALTREKKFIIIKGRKSFKTVTINNMNVSGTIIGHNIKEILLKSANQTISGQKTIQGSINASSFIIDGLINDVNLTSITNHQLRKENPSQRIKTGIELQNALKIFGNLTINGSYGKAEWGNFYDNYLIVVPVVEKMWRYSKVAEMINTALRNRAVYINKLEVVKQTDAISVFNETVILQKEQCKVKNSSRFCANEYIVNVILNSNSNDFILIKSIFLDEDEFIVWIKFNSVSIYLYDNMQKSLSLLTDLHIPNIIDAFVEPMLRSLWIALRLSMQTLVLHYQPWKDFQEYVLPPTNVFTMSRSPNNQLLLLLSDGIWNLESLASPQHIIEIPLKDKVEIFISKPNYYIKCTLKNNSTLMRTRYVGN